MKKILIMAVLSIGMIGFAQNGKRNLKHQLTSEEQVDLHLKRMTLDLELSNKQQQDIRPFLLKQAQQREAQKVSFSKMKDSDEKPSKEDFLKKEHSRLDNEIVMQKKMREILTDLQYEKWNQMKTTRKEKNKKHKNKFPNK